MARALQPGKVHLWRPILQTGNSREASMTASSQPKVREEDWPGGERAMRWVRDLIKSRIAPTAGWSKNGTPLKRPGNWMVLQGGKRRVPANETGGRDPRPVAKRVARALGRRKVDPSEK